MLVLAGLVLCEPNSPKFTWSRGGSSVTGSLVHDEIVRGSSHEELDYSCVGVTTSGGTLKQKLVSTCGGNKNVGSRLYLLDSSGSKYEMFNPIGNQFTYTVDMSQTTCGTNAALYTVEMPAGGDNNDAAFGTGYCDANFVDGTGCAEFDIQEANSQAMVYTSHPCSKLGQFANNGADCSQDGCGFNAYRYGAKTFWGTDVNTKSAVTVVTAFKADSSGNLAEITRSYVQGGRTIPNPTVTVYNTADYNSITDKFCQTAGHSVDGWHGLSQMGASFKKGHVLVFSFWDSSSMGWLDGNGEYGPCTNQQTADQIESGNPGMTITWSDLKFGPA